MTSPPPSGYDTWTREDLIARLKELDHTPTWPRSRSKSPKLTAKDVFPPIQCRRKIALKFCYSGWEYGGLAFQKLKTTLPTVEETLFGALVKARLVDPEGSFEGCGWERCGRTDRGVSAAGQVVSLWIRSALEEPATAKIIKPEEHPSSADAPSSSSSTSLSNEEETIPRAMDGLDFGFDDELLAEAPTNYSVSQKPKPEFDYLAMLNRLLPPTIRITAWSPVSDNFSARFSCTHRHYKYFFSTNIIPGPPLDIECMRKAASLLVGEHDFRNLCKIDPGKQITMFRRVVKRATISPLNVDNEGNGLYVFDLIGSAFLYHQVRHIMAILFIVGSGLEEPSVLLNLMNVEKGLESNPDNSTPLPVVESKPEYQMADALPLMLWDCDYRDGELDWRTSARDPTDDSTSDSTELYEELHAIHARSEIFTTLNEYFLAAAAHYHRPPANLNRLPGGSSAKQPGSASSPDVKYGIPLGGGSYRRTAPEKYVPILQRNRLDTPEVINERWRVGKGFRREERRKGAAEAEDNSDE